MQGTGHELCFYPQSMRHVCSLKRSPDITTHYLVHFHPSPIYMVVLQMTTHPTKKRLWVKITLPSRYLQNLCSTHRIKPEYEQSMVRLQPGKCETRYRFRVVSHGNGRHRFICWGRSLSSLWRLERGNPLIHLCWVCKRNRQRASIRTGISKLLLGTR